MPVVEMPPEPEGSDPQDVLASLVEALESLSIGDVRTETTAEASFIASALFDAMGGDREQLAMVAEKLRNRGVSLTASDVPPNGICSTGCPPDSPAPIRRYQREGETIDICDHEPTHRYDVR